MPHRRAYLERLVDGRAVSSHPLTHERGRQFIGREHQTVVALDHPSLAEKHVLLEFGPLGRWWLDDMGTRAGTWVNHTHYAGNRRLLEPGDLIRFGEDLVFRFCVEGWEPADAPLRALIDADPEDDARWEVWADFLEERGDPLAQRIRGFGPSPGDLGVGSGHLWEHGFIRKGVLQRGGRVLAAVNRELRVLLGSPFSRWMLRLHVDLASFQDGAFAEELEGVKVMQALVQLKPSSLRVLTFAFTRPPADVRLRQEFRTLQEALPKLRSNFEAIVKR